MNLAASHAIVMNRLVLTVGLASLFLPLTHGTDCPGGLVRCPSYMTCCELANKEYGCCPFQDAMCCRDHVHCCPQGMECDVAQQTCKKNGSPVHFYWQVPIQPEPVEPRAELPKETQNEVEDNSISQRRDDKCPDGHPCPSVYTCCKMYKGGYGCCPFRDAQCCSDGFHCCPVGSHCNSSTGGCVHDKEKLTLDAYRLPVKKLREQSESRPVRSEVADPGGKCPDGHPCPEKFTCCKVQDQGYGCCPYAEAVCCTDFIHCCPKGTNCNTTLGTCDKERTQSFSVPAFSLVTRKLAHSSKLEELHKPAVNTSFIVCPDERYRCPKGNTCCQLGSGAYGCCPMDHATCCSDKMSCCPNGYKCVKDGCEKVSPQDNAPLQQKLLPAEKITKKEENTPDYQVVVCPDKRSVCPDENTCCDIGSGLYGCCPMPKATCCSDKEHCCPHGYRCSSEGCSKTSEDSLQLITLKFSNISETLGYAKGLTESETPTLGLVCPDKESQCPDGNTCCKIGGGEYGCCPMPKATCCKDEMHCCPHGYICTDGGCKRQAGSPFIFPGMNLKFTTTKRELEDNEEYPRVVLLP